MACTEEIRWPSGKVVVVALCFAFVTALGALGEVNPQSRGVLFFNSPMILDFGLDEFSRNPASLVTTELSFFSCQGVTMDRLILRLGGSPGDAAAVSLSMTLFNNSGKDKRGPVTFDLMDGDRKISSVTTKSVKIGQGEKTEQNTVLPVPAGLIPGRTGLKLRITTVLENY